jgi:hypothetical protein
MSLMDNYLFKLYITYLRNEVVLSATSLNHFYFSLIKTQPLCWLEVVSPIKKGFVTKRGRFVSWLKKAALQVQLLSVKPF